MDKDVLTIASREIAIRLKSGIFLSMFGSFLFVMTLAPWLFNFDSTEPSSGVQAINSSHISILFTIYGILVSSCTLLSYGMIEEKASAVIDILLSSVNAGSILKGKILGIVALTITEMAILSLAGVASSSIRSASTLSLSIPFLLSSFSFLVPALIIYTFIVATVSFRIRKVEEMGILQLPLLLSLAVCLFAGVYSMTSPSSNFATYGRWIPVASSFVTPVLMESKKISFGISLASLALAFCMAYGIAKLCQRVFISHAVK